MATNKRKLFERILCPIDLTLESEESLRYGIALAKSYGSKLFVINCVESNGDSQCGSRQHIKDLLDAAVQQHLRLPASPHFTWKSTLIEGDPKTAIAKEAAEQGIDLIVMRSRRRPYTAQLLGSTAESTCRTAPCPIMITHPRGQNWVGATTNEIGLQSVLVAYDFSSDSELALSIGLSLAQEHQAEVHLLHVLPERSYKPVVPEFAFLPAHNGFQEAARRLQDSVPPETRMWCKIKHAVRDGHPYREVLAYADAQNIDLICMGASGTGFGIHALFGSNADRVLRQAPCPVLIARPLKPMLATQKSLTR